jgi:indole-3-glycerol phosphate synthase
MMSIFAEEAGKLGAVAVGTNVDTGAFRGGFEDLEDLKKSTTLPVVCDDFVVYGYQLFRGMCAVSIP